MDGKAWAKRFARRQARTQEFRKGILKRCKYHCVSCGVQLRMDGPMDEAGILALGYAKLTLDHIIPRSKGGNIAEANMQAMCRPCNGVKGSDWPQ